MYDSIGFGHAFRRIAQDRIIQLQRLGKFLKSLRGIRACGKIGDFGLLQERAILTE